MTPLVQYLLNFRYAFRPDKPLLTLRLANAVVRSTLLRQKRLRYVDFALDFRCNLHCQHCFATVLANPKAPRMAHADYERVAREAMELGAVHFSFQGGEPLLLPDLDATVAACQPARNLISVTTNGTLVTPETAVRLRRAGVDILTVSLDSSIPEEHDRFRGSSGAYERTVAGIQAALAAGLRVTLGTVVTRGSLRGPGLAGLVALAERLRTVLYLIMPVPAGRWRDADDILLEEQDLSDVFELTRRTPYVRTDFQANLGGYGCGAAKEILYLSPHGDVLPCPFLHISMGNVLNEPLRVLRDRALANPYFAEYKQTCLVSTDEEFLAGPLSRTLEARRLPLAWKDGFPPGGEPPRRES